MLTRAIFLMTMKYRDTRIATFKEDYNPQRRTDDKGKVTSEGKVLYKKGQKYAIHHKTLDKIKGRGAKFDAEKLDVEKVHADMKAKLQKQKEKAK